LPHTDGGGNIPVETRLLHASGEWMGTAITMNPQDGKPQSAGSAITYGRRYALAAMVGVVSDDEDDGNAASLASRPSGTREAPTPGDAGEDPAAKAAAREAAAKALAGYSGLSGPELATAYKAVCKAAGVPESQTVATYKAVAAWCERNASAGVTFAEAVAGKVEAPK
jgi:hypothetical protein